MIWFYIYVTPEKRQTSLGIGVFWLSIFHALLVQITPCPELTVRRATCNHDNRHNPVIVPASTGGDQGRVPVHVPRAASGTLQGMSAVSRHRPTGIARPLLSGQWHRRRWSFTLADTARTSGAFLSIIFSLPTNCCHPWPAQASGTWLDRAVM